LNRQLFEYHPSIGYRFIPGLQTREPHEGGGFLLRTNQAGYRCRHEFARERPPGTFRILLFGDSYTAETGCGPAIASPRWPAACSGFVATAITSMRSEETTSPARRAHSRRQPCHGSSPPLASAHSQLDRNRTPLRQRWQPRGARTAQERAVPHARTPDVRGYHVTGMDHVGERSRSVPRSEP
jgi:hypothetical protein